MKRRRILRPLALGLSVCTVCTPLMSTSAYANVYTNFDLRKKVIGLSGIMGITGDLTRNITRAEFARMLVRASSQRSILTTTSNVSVFEDVSQGSEYAAAIRIAAENGWMTGFLGGNFKPDSYVTFNDAAKGVLYLLGYTAEDFAGDEYNKRLAKFASLDLNTNISYTLGTEYMTANDCINLFYNLMKTSSKNSNSAYATVLGASLSSDGEVNAMSMADTSLKGPRVATTKQEVYNSIPFSLGDANIFVNGAASTASSLLARVGDSRSTGSYLVLYYSASAKTIWAYDESSSDTERRVARGEITNIYYESSSTLTPTRVVLDDNGDGDVGDGTFSISSTDMQFAFSIYGSLGIGDTVTLIYSVSTDNQGNEQYTIVDYVEE